LSETKQPLVRSIFLRRDSAIIGELIDERSRVLDLGCGDGELLAWLAENKHCDARGIELLPELAQAAIARGVSCYQGDIESSLADYPDQAFDYVILSQTLQQVRKPVDVLQQMLRVGRKAIVAFPNFGHYSVRLSHLFSGRAPQNKLFPHDWYDSPNIHFLTIDDFELLCHKQAWRIERTIFVAGDRQVTALPNLMAEVGVFLIAKR
jgi:methionine biosynthesis protein MetW